MPYELFKADCLTGMVEHLIPGIEREKFEAELRRTLSPSAPIKSPEMLRGRERNLEQIRRAFVQMGRHIFIYGDRGVGKTSLALTAAYEHESAHREPLMLTCRGTFFDIARDLLHGLADKNAFFAKSSKNQEFSLLSVIGAKAVKSGEDVKIGDLRSINEIVATIRDLTKNPFHNG
ncbi:ATP-binding protein [Roseomonas mucosa]|uniref:ATP-binding protein n=1 Tax=Roseomonas mucosa TaxID=207340 RepID=UPI0030CBBA38